MISVDVETIPSVHTVGFVTLISDSGIVRYRLGGNIWQEYNNATEPYWYFPDGIHVEQFDSLFQIEVEIVADTAYNFRKTGLWHAIGNVVAKNKSGRLFETSELFWNSKAPMDADNAFYTSKKVKVTEPNGTFFYGQKGFNADQNLNTPRFYDQSESVIYFEESETAPQQQVIRIDSIQSP